METQKNDYVDFIKQLKSQHKSIISTIYEIDGQPGGPTNIASSTEKLNRLTDILFDHLEKEDKQLYPTLINNNETAQLGKKYFYDMERLSCIALDFFKRYCVNREGQKVFVEDFINSYSLFKGLLKVRIKREETELYPAFILLMSGVLHSDVLEYVQESAKKNEKQKTVFIYGDDNPSKSALLLALEINGYKVDSTHEINRISSLSQALQPDLILIDINNSNKELCDLVSQLKNQVCPGIKLVGYSNSSPEKVEENLQKTLDSFISKPSVDIEKFSNKINQLLS